ncbi:hypothetical protein GUJ93_ZPchr0011g28407 [Zizania palustris]|uniref:Uncharacterized protein n=1 Tax=Zizania palustris TaxID=103762 RepID=A0A8J5WIG0_ZIZPA|nr:hypothetical protein GUJ93_ZPchr0011g28407 [Zizania palustris]
MTRPPPPPRMTTTASSSCSTGKKTLATPRSDLGRFALTHRRRARADCGCRWWREAQDGARIDAQGVPYVAAPSGPTSYGMKVPSLLISDLAFTLRRANDLLLQPDASDRSYALVGLDKWGLCHERDRRQ